MSHMWGAAAGGEPVLGAIITGGDINLTDYNPTFPVSIQRTISVTNGSGSQTYSWSTTVLGVTLLNTTTSVVTIRFPSAGEYNGALSCTVTDGGQNASDSVSVIVFLGFPE